MKNLLVIISLLLVFAITKINAQTINDNELVYQQAKIVRYSNHNLLMYSGKKIGDTLIVKDKYESYRRTSIILESIGGSLVSVYAYSSLNNHTSTNIGFLYSGIGVSLVGLIMNIKANKMSGEFVRLHNASKNQIFAIAPLIRSKDFINEVGVAIRF